MPKLGVNIDHIATLRQARREFDPDPIAAARICERAGADSIVCHLREDRRHINDADIRKLRKTVESRFNLEMSLSPEIVRIVQDLRPDQATIVPERRQEITTEGGLDVLRHFRRIQSAVQVLQKRRITVSLFIDPDPIQIRRSLETGARMIELHTGRYAAARNAQQQKHELNQLKEMTRYASEMGLTVNAGHGLKYHDTAPVAKIKGMEELNIGHSIVSRAVFVGLDRAVREMLQIVKR